jgi:hypothetical protein
MNSGVGNGKQVKEYKCSRCGSMEHTITRCKFSYAPTFGFGSGDKGKGKK